VRKRPFCQSVLRRHWPDTIRYADVRELRGADIISACGGRPTLLTGGFPCQPASIAGKRRGSGDERWLWPELFRIIRDCRPHWFVGENVPGLLSLPEFPGIIADLENEGYEIGTFRISAAAVGAPHIRDRIFIVAADADGDGRDEKPDSNAEQGKKEIPWFGSICRSIGNRSHPPTNTYCQGCNPRNPMQITTDPRYARIINNRRNDRCWALADQGDNNPRKNPRDLPLPDWSQDPPAICRVDDGVPRGLDTARLRALGNAIVPRQIYPIFAAIAELEQKQYA